METIRICEESDARLMIREGCLCDYVNMWCDKFPQRAMDVRGKFFLIRDIKYELSCTLLESKGVVDSLGSNYSVLADSVVFEIGNNVRIEKTGGILRLYIRATDNREEWREGDMRWLESKDCELYLFPFRAERMKARRRPQRIEFGAF